MTIAIPVLVCIGGAIAHLGTTKLSTLGAWAFGVGLWYVLAAVGGSALHVG